jgi:hypothetical protein
MRLAIILKEVNTMFAKVSYPTFPGKMDFWNLNSLSFRMMAHLYNIFFSLLYKIYNVEKLRIFYLLHVVKNSVTIEDC